MLRSIGRQCGECVESVVEKEEEGCGLRWERVAETEAVIRRRRVAKHD